jgi:hypothetical protein
MTEMVPTSYSGPLGRIKERSRAAQCEAMRAASYELIGLLQDLK